MEITGIIAVLLFKVLGIQCLSPPDLFSEWYDMEAYVTPEITINHNFGELPMKVDVQVKINDPNFGEVIFLATGSAQTGDFPSANFGGVIYVYNTISIKILGPGPIGCTTCNGGLVYLGGTNFYGPTPATANGLYKTAKVRARAWKTCTFVRPSYISGEIEIANSPIDKTFYTEDIISPDLVLVKVKINDDWMTDAQGMASYSDTSNPIGGVLYAYDHQSVKIWTPREENGNTNGYVFSGIGYGNDGNFVSTHNATCRFFSWTFAQLEKNPSDKLNVFYKGEGYSDEKILTTEMDPTINSTLLLVEANPTTPSVNFLLSFPVSGSAMSDGQISGGNYGSVFYAFNITHLLFWRPVSSGQGCSILVDGMWGNGEITECSVKVAVSLRYLLATYDELPCGELPCSGTEAGPFCACEGTGFTGQYCSSRVPCPIPERGVDYINAGYSPARSTYKFQDYVELTCLSGYSYSSGADNKTCNESMLWTGAMYTCDPLPCPPPESPTNANVLNIDAFFNGTANYECFPGKDVETGNLQRRCQANQTWSGDAPVCIGSCGQPGGSVEAHRLNTGTTYNVIAEFACNDGYEYKSGDLSRTCFINGSWGGSPAVCDKVSCPPPVDGTHSTVTYNSTLYQDEAVYECDIGYQVNQYVSPIITCKADKTWSDDPVPCERVVCGDPGNPDMAYLNTTTSTVGSLYYQSVQNYHCYEGYMLKTGGLRLECQANGQWSAAAPVCEVISCSQPSDVVNGTVFVDGTDYLHYVVTVCDYGYAIKSGNAARQCDATGSWSGTNPVCELATVYFNGNAPSSPIQNYSSGNSNRVLLDLLVPPKSTNRYHRSLNSQSDNRPSTLLVGCIGILVLILVCGYICLLDFIKHIRVNGKVKVIQGQETPHGVGEEGTQRGKQKKPKK